MEVLTINIRSFLSVALMLLLLSCEKFVEVPPPRDQIITTDVFKDSESADAAVSSLYSQMMRTALFFTNAGMSIYPALSADELYNTSPNADLDLFVSNSLNEGMAVLNNNFWIVAYKNIYQANAIIQGLEKSTTISQTAKTQLIAETKFNRAFIYFYLINLFGDVPLVTGTEYNYNATLPRNHVTEVYQQIILDLQDAQQGLSETYTNTGRTRANKWAAASLLSKVYLYTDKWAEAESTATTVINSGVYSLASDPNNVFISTSNEVILQFYPVISSANTSQAAQFIPASATTRPTYGITNSLMNAFEAGDSRKTKWTKTVTVSGQSYTHPYKYKVRSGTTITENNVVFRLAEVYLIRAEARNRQNKITEARSDLDKVRNRAGLGNTTANTTDALSVAIERERSVELFTEWGNRWFDLKRTQRADAVLSPIKGNNWQSTDVLYPIPESEMNKNPFLVQNPGY